MSAKTEYKSVSLGMNRNGLTAGSRGRGFSLVEIMVAIALGLLLIGTVVQSYVGSRKVYNITEGMSRIQENYRYAMSHFARNLDAGGYEGCLENIAGKHISTLDASTGIYGYDTPVTGVEGGASPDQVILSRAIGAIRIPFRGKVETWDNDLPDHYQDIPLDSSVAEYAKLEQYQIVTLSNCTTAVTFMITNDPTSSGGIIEHHAGEVSPGPLNAGRSNTTTFIPDSDPFGDGETSGSTAASLYTTVGIVYSIGTSAAGNRAGVVCDTTDSSTHRFCALLANGDELVEGVHDLQVTFGVPDSSNIKYLNVDQLSTAEKQNVQSIRLTLAMNSVQEVDNGNVISKQFTRVFRVRNKAP